MKRSRKLLENVLDAVHLDTALQPRLPVLELAGDQRVLVENHKSVIHYSNEQVLIRVDFGQLCVKGCALKLARLGRDQLVITGRIDSILLCRR